MNKKPIQSYTEVVTHKGEKLDITINIYKEPCIRNDEHEFYTHIRITKHGHLWGELFLINPIKESEFEQSIKDVAKNIESYKKNYEFNKEQFSKN